MTSDDERFEQIKARADRWHVFYEQEIVNAPEEQVIAPLVGPDVVQDFDWLIAEVERLTDAG